MNNVRTRIAALVLTFVLLAPVLFIVAEAQHDCQGDECQVCQVLAIASSIIQTAADVSAAASEAALFNMSKTLSRGKSGPGPSISLKSGPFLYINSRCGDFGVSFRRSSLQFNIRPWRSLAGQSVATAEASTSNRQSVHACGALGARRKGT